jgi:hypothetical protein
MALKVESGVKGCVHADKAPGRAGHLEALHLAVSSSHGLVRNLDPIVLECAY